MEIVVTGSVAYDYLMSFPGYFREHILPERLETISLSFLVDSMVRRRGGTGPNIAYTLALLGQRPRLLATAGEDFEEYRIWLEANGVDTSSVEVIAGEFTASFFANTDRANAQIASFYPGAMAYATQVSLHRLQHDGKLLVVVSPNDPQAMHQIVGECLDLDLPYVYDPSQQIVRLDAAALMRGIEGATALFVNDYEYRLIGKKTGMTMEEVLEHVDYVVVTVGDQGATVYARNQEVRIPPIPPQTVVDPTGVGDAFRGGFLTGVVRGWDWELCGYMGAMAATYCLEREGSQGHQFTRRAFVNRLRDHYDDRDRLDELLNS